MMKNQSFPVYCINAFPNQIHQSFYINSLSLVRESLKLIDQSHSHDFYMILYVVKGSGIHTIDFVDYPIQASTLYFLTPGQVHSWQLSPDIEAYNIFFEADFYLKHYPESLYQYPFFHSNQYQPILQLTDNQDFARDLVKGMWEETENKFANKPEVFLAYLHILLEKSVRFYEMVALENASPISFLKLRDFELLVNQHFLSLRKTSEYAEMLHISTNYLNAICKKTINKTASQILHERIITEAKRLLAHTKLTIKEIAYKLQFEDASYFSRFFKKVSQQSPEDFRLYR